jgi:ribosomal protein L37E
MAAAGHQAVFTTAQAMAVTGLSRRDIQRFEVEGGLRPFRPGRRGAGGTSFWSIMQVAGLAFGTAFLDAELDCQWAFAACLWLARQQPGPLRAELEMGRTLISLSPDGEGRLVKPKREGLSPENLRLLKQLDLKAIYDRTIERLREVITASACKHCGGLTIQAGHSYCCECGKPVDKTARTPAGTKSERQRPPAALPERRGGLEREKRHPGHADL